MSGHEKATQKTKEQVDKKHRFGQRETQPSPEWFHAQEQGGIPDIETPFLPRMDQHASLLSDTRSTEAAAGLVLRLQQAYGNRYVQYLLKSNGVRTKPLDFKTRRQPAGSQPETVSEDTGLITLDQLAENLRRERRRHFGRITAQGPIRFRLPTAADLKSVHVSGTVPEDVLIESIRTALTRMVKEGRVQLEATDSVSDVIKRIFPEPGVFDEAAYKELFDETNRSIIYQGVLEAEMPIAETDKPKLKETMEKAKALIQQSAADIEGLQQVFGERYDDAQRVYGGAAFFLNRAIGDMDKHISTDYSLGDVEIGLSGKAYFMRRRIHLQLDIAQVREENHTIIVLIHEACHLSGGLVIDRSHYGAKGFETMSEDDKVNNAAHYEEIPRRKLKMTSYGENCEFKPVESNELAFEQEVSRLAIGYLQKARLAAIGELHLLQDFRKDILEGKPRKFEANKSKIMETSEKMNLTIHKQGEGNETITPVDIILAEGVARGIWMLPKYLKKADEQLGGQGALMRKIAEENPTGKTAKFYAERMIEYGIIIEGHETPLITGSVESDMELLEWLVEEYP